MPLMLGVFLGNWLVVPILFRGRHDNGSRVNVLKADHRRGFWVGLIAAVIVYVLY